MPGEGAPFVVDHVTAVVADADAAAIALSPLLGAGPLASVELPAMSIRTFRVGEVEIHVNAPKGPGPVEAHLRAHGPSLHHLALRVVDLDGTLRALAAMGLRALGEPVETAPGLREVFLDPAATGGLLVQLVERRDASVARALDAGALSRLAAQAPGGDDIAGRLVSTDVSGESHE